MTGFFTFDWYSLHPEKTADSVFCNYRQFVNTFSRTLYFLYNNFLDIRKLYFRLFIFKKILLGINLLKSNLIGISWK